jgi:hypothetical protein
MVRGLVQHQHVRLAPGDDGEGDARLLAACSPERGRGAADGGIGVARREGGGSALDERTFHPPTGAAI